MRHEKAETVLKLAIAMQGSAQGLSLVDIQGAIGEITGGKPASRRTAERMRDAVGNVFPIEEVFGEGRTKRWRLRHGSINRLLNVSAEDLSALEQARRLLKRERMPDAKVLQQLAGRLKANLRESQIAEVGPRMEEILAAEGLALRPGPRPRVSEADLNTLRSAIIDRSKVQFLYRNKEGRRSRHTVCPYGFIFGNKQFLVAWKEDFDDYWLFRLSAMDEVTRLPDAFERDPGFSLDTYARRAFVTFQGAPVDVAWKFSPEAAPDALEFEFHPTQAVEKKKDGSVIVRFRAALSDEMCWHLFTWGSRVEILEPPELREQYREWVKMARSVAG